MSVKLPDGIVLAIATTYGASKTVSAVTNADPAVATITSHGYEDGDIIEVKSGWNLLNDILVRVDNKVTSALDYEGQDTANTTKYPANSGVGSVRKITTFQQITQVTEISSSGGEPGNVTYSFLEENFERSLPTAASPVIVTGKIADDDSLPGYQALKKVAESQDTVALRMTFPNGSIFLFNTVVALGVVPSMSKGNIMELDFTLNLQGKPVRYSGS